MTSPGYFSAGGANASTQSQQNQCPPGSYCSNGVAVPCSAGTYRSLTGGITAADCGLCPAGYFCVAGASIPNPCGADSVYCPAGSSVPTSVNVGYYSVGTVGQRSDKQACPLGSFCLDGVAYPCSGGRYANATGLSSCITPCPSGFYCPTGTSFPLPCGDPSVYCLSGSSSPTPVTAGYYSALPAVTDSLANASSTLTTQMQCRPGFYCPVGGVEVPCSLGTYRASSGASSAQDCLLCPPGYLPAAGVCCVYPRSQARTCGGNVHVFCVANWCGIMLGQR